MTPAVLRGPATEAVPALPPRPWREEAGRRPATQRQGRADGTYLGFTVAEDEGDGGGEKRLLADVALKRTVPTPGTAETGYRTAPHARGRGVASRAPGIRTDWAFASKGHPHARRA
ncbi:GNAT family N-acetyltransferase [Streptomyces sp. NPDC015345]|uniref:GNAT family N-acetyltransferase n=1 Tax=Streptomyces sp. NPDC015345 TaxID=3364953 RepID=UPI0037021068